jgi:hypothetical protein
VDLVIITMSDSQQSNRPPPSARGGRGRGRRGRGKGRGGAGRPRGPDERQRDTNGVLGVDGKVHQSNRRRKEKSDKTLDERKDLVQPNKDEKDDDESVKAFIANHVPEAAITVDQVKEANEGKQSHEILVLRDKTLTAYSAFPSLGLVKPDGSVNQDFDKRKITIKFPLTLFIGEDGKNSGEYASGSSLLKRVNNRIIQDLMHKELVKRSDDKSGNVWPVPPDQIRHLFVCDIRLNQALNCTGTDMTVLPVALVPRPFKESFQKRLLSLTKLSPVDEVNALQTWRFVFFDLNDRKARHRKPADTPRQRLERRVADLNETYGYDRGNGPNDRRTAASWHVMRLDNDGSIDGDALRLNNEALSVNVFADDEFVPIGKARKGQAAVLYGKAALEALGRKIIRRQAGRDNDDDDEEKEKPVISLDNVIRSHGEHTFDCRIYTAGNDALEFDDASKRERFDRNIFMNPLLELFRALFGGGLGNYCKTDASFVEWCKLPLTGDNSRKVFLDLPNDKDHTWPSHLSYVVARTRKQRRDNYIEERRKELEKEYDEKVEQERDERRKARAEARAKGGAEAAAPKKTKKVLKSEKLIDQLAAKAIKQYLDDHPDKTRKSLTLDERKEIVKSFLADAELTTSLRKFTFATEDDLKPEHYGPSVKNKMKISYKQLLGLLKTMNDAFPNAELVLQLNSPGKDASDFALLFAPKAPLPNMTVERTLSLEVEMTVIPAM